MPDAAVQLQESYKEEGDRVRTILYRAAKSSQHYDLLVLPIG